MKAINKSHARELAASMNLSNVPRSLAGEVVNYWGPVLYRNEFTRPRCLGGWFREIEKGVDVSFLNINGNMQVPQMEEAANWAYAAIFFTPYPWKSLGKSKTKRAKTFPNEWLESADEDLFLNNERTFRSGNDVFENIRAWNSFENKLKKEFSKACSWWSRRSKLRRTFADVYKSECDKRPKEDIIPPVTERLEVKSFEVSYTQDVVFEHPYRVTDPAIDLSLWLAGKNFESYPRKMGLTGQLNLGAKDIPKMKKGAAQRAISLRHLYGTGRVPLKKWNMYLVPSQDTFEYWHNPFAVGGVADAWCRNYNSFIPKYISEEKKELLLLRDRFFNKRLTWREWMEIGTMAPCDIVIISLFKDSFGRFINPYDNNDYAMDVVVRAFKRYPGFGKFIDICENFNEETINHTFSKWMIAHEVLLAKKNEREQEKEEEAFRKREAALFEAYNFDDDIVVQKHDIDEYYGSRSYDPPGMYEKDAEEEVVFDIDKIADEIAENCKKSYNLDEPPITLNSMWEEEEEFTPYMEDGEEIVPFEDLLVGEGEVTFAEEW